MSGEATAFEYDPDDCEAFVAACAVVRDTLADIGAHYGAAYRDEYVRQLVAVLAPGSALAEAAGKVEQPRPIFRAQ